MMNGKDERVKSEALGGAVAGDGKAIDNEEKKIELSSQNGFKC